MQPVQDTIWRGLIPKLIHRQPDDLEIHLLTLPAVYGGMCFDDLVVDSSHKHMDSIERTTNLTSLIKAGKVHLPHSSDPDRAAKSIVRSHHRRELCATADALQKHLPEPQHRAMELAHMKGASSTLTMIPVEQHRFYLKCKSDFHDHVHLRYGWPVENLPSTCPCGARYSVQHSQICKLAGFISVMECKFSNPPGIISSKRTI